jgi:autotransporter-associated beta strand protein
MVGGTLTIPAPTNYSLGTQVNGGTIVVEAGGTMGRNVGSNKIDVAGGVLSLAAPAANIGSAQVVRVNAGTGGVTSPTGVDQAFLDGIAPRLDAASTGAVLLADGATNANSLGFAGLGSMTLGTRGTAAYSGALTPNGTTYRLGGGGGTLSIAAGADLTGAGNSLTVTGPGTVVLADAKTYGGSTTLASGTLSVAGDFIGAAGSAMTFNGGTLQITGTEFSSLPADRTITWGAAGGSFEIAEAGHTFTVPQTLAGGPITKRGPGELALTGVSTLTGMVVKGGAVRLPGVATVVNGTTAVGDVTGDVGILSLPDAAARLTTNLLFVGSTGNAIGTLNVHGATVQYDGNGEWRIGGSGGTGDAAAQGTLNISGGAITLPNVNLQIGAFGQGWLNMSGGSISDGYWPCVGRFNGSVGRANITGGTFYQAPGRLNPPERFIVAELGTGELTVSGTGTMDLSGGLRVGLAAAGNGTVNLNTGGTIYTPLVEDTGGRSQFNFNGGTLRARTGNPNFFQGLDTVFVHAGGGTIDTFGYDVTIGQAMLAAPAGRVTGFSGLVGGSGYTSPPLVSIIGDGAGATAYATLDDSGAVSSIVIGNPGSGYTWAGFTISPAPGGAGEGAAAVAEVTANAGGGLTKIGNGTLTLTGANTYTGATVINAGALQLGNGAVSGSVAGDIVNHTALIFNNPTTVTCPGNISGEGTLQKLGEGTAVLSGDNSYEGASSLVAGILALGSPGALGPTSTISFNGGTLQFTAANTTDYCSRFSTAANPAYKFSTAGTATSVTLAGNLGANGGSLTIGGEGTVVLTGSNTFTEVTLLGGNLALGSADAIGPSGTIHFHGGTLQFTSANTTDYCSRFSTAPNQAYKFGTAGAATTVTLAGDLGANGASLGISGEGTVVLTGSNTFTDVALTGGKLSLGSAGAIGSAGPISFSGGTLQFTAVNTADYSARFSTAANQAYSLETPDAAMTVTLASPLTSSNGSLTKSGPGTLVLTAANTYGPTTVAGGTLQVVNAGTLGSGNVTLANNAGLVFNRSDDVTLSSAVGGVGSLTQAGSGVLNVSGVLSYDGPTTIAAGTVRLASPSFGMAAHRWSFNGNLRDSAGNSEATIVVPGPDNHATLGPAQVALAGGPKGNADYVSLGTGLVPKDGTPVTIEVWATQNQVQNWSRIFDFGIDPSNYLMMSWTQGVDLNADRVSFKEGGGGESLIDNRCAPYALGTEYHVAMVVTPGGGAGGLTRVEVYAAPSASATLGAARGFVDTTYTLAELQDVNMWLGQSQYADNTASASFNEARLWNAALTAADLDRLHALGPDGDIGTGKLPSRTALDLTASGATLDVNGGKQIIGSLSGVEGSLVTLGTGTLTTGGNDANTTFAGVISSDPAISSPAYDSLVKEGTGRMVLSAKNTYLGTTTIANGVLDAVEGMGLPVESGLYLGSKPVNGVSTAGVLQTSGTFRRAVATSGLPAAGNVVWQSGGGFAAREGDLVVNLGLDSTPPNDDNPLALTWDQPGFVKSDAPLAFGSATANGTVVWKNPVRLTADSGAYVWREFAVKRGTGAGPEVDIQGEISDAPDAQGWLDKTGDGALKLSMANTYLGGTIVEAGTLIAANSSGSATGPGPVAVYPAAMLASGPTGAVAGMVSVSSGATVAPGALGALGVLTLHSGLSLNGGAVLDFDVIGVLQDVLTLHGPLSLFSSEKPLIALHASGVLSGEYVLATFPASAVALSNFNWTGVPEGYVLEVSQDQIKLSSATGPAEWKTTGSGNWSAGSNWTTGTPPDGIGAYALLGTKITGDTVVQVDADVTLGALELDSADRYDVEGPSTIAMQVGTGNARINNKAGSHTISAPLALTSGTNVTVAVESDALTIDGGIVDSAGGLTKLGPGTLVLSGSGHYRGGTTVADGTLRVGAVGALPHGAPISISSGARLVLAEGLVAGAADRAVAMHVTALTAVPEPGSLALLAVIVAMVLVGVVRARRAAPLTRLFLVALRRAQGEGFTKEAIVAKGDPALGRLQRVFVLGRSEVLKDSEDLPEELKFFSHESPLEGKKSPWDRAKLKGATASAENIISGQRDGKSANMAWFHSPGHHKNMLGEHARVGIGRSGTHYTEMFGK